MKVLVGVAIAVLGFASARAARTLAKVDQPADITSAPYAPSPAAAPLLSLGYREVAAYAVASLGHPYEIGELVRLHGADLRVRVEEAVRDGRIMPGSIAAWRAALQRLSQQP